MQLNKANQKAQAILKAIAAGRSCEQILANDKTLTYHDIFHSVADAQTNHWRKLSAGRISKGWLRTVPPAVRQAARQRID